MSETVVIGERFRGPPHSANGGYACALLARRIEGSAQVTLRAPPPLGEDLIVRETDAGVELADADGTLLAEAVPVGAVEVDVPAPIGIEAAERASALYPWRDTHPYPSCFVCGPDREHGDGMRIFPGPVAGERIFAAPWTPDEELANADGHVRFEYVWGALDCPSGIVTDLFGEVGRILLGRLTADLRKPVMAGSAHTIQAWPISREGRRMTTGSAIFGTGGDLRAVARAIWIEVPALASDG